MFFALLLQCVVVALAIAASGFWMGWVVAQATAYGTLVALVNSCLIVGCWYNGLRDYHCNGERHLRSFHRSSLERFFVVGILLALGFGLLNLLPQAMLMGFIVGQFAWAVAITLARRLF